MSETTRFRSGQRVRIVAEDHPLHGETGTVSRVMLRGGGARGMPTEAWVKMDRPLPPHLRRFPEGDHRADMAPFYDFECAAIREAPEGG